MLSLIRMLARSRSGSITTITAFCAPAVFAILGVAIDYVMMAHVKGQLQAAADAAALAGVKELSLAGATKTQVKAVAENFAYDNLRELPSGKNGALSIDIKIAKEKHTVDVDITKEWTPFFLHFIAAEITPIRAHAQASTIGLRLACVLGLAPLVPPSVQLWANASLIADGCDVYSNTKIPLGLVVNDNATLKADLILRERRLCCPEPRCRGAQADYRLPVI